MTPRRLGLLLAAAIVVIGVAAAAPAAYRALHTEKKANPIAADPMPRALFPTAEFAAITRCEDAAIARADTVAAAYLRAHPRRDDAAFARFVKAQVPPPPTLAERRADLPLIRRLERTRDARRRAIVAWLFLHGKKDVWKLYLHQYREFVGKKRGKPAKALFKLTLATANTINTQLKGTIREPHPLQLDPSLDPIVPHPGKTHAETVRLDKTKYSYPSNHTNISTAVATVLGSLEPQRAQEYLWMASEVSYSRLVAGVHFVGDLVGGAFEGRLIADYEIHFAEAK